MKEEGALDQLCPIHSEKIVSVILSDEGESQMFCYKCLPPEQMSIEQLSQQLTELRSKKIEKLIELQKQSVKRFLSLKKVFQNIKQMFNQQIEDIIKNTDNQMYEAMQTIKKQTEILNQPISQLSINQIVQYIKEAKEEVTINDQQQNYKQLKVKMIKQYIQLVKQLNKQINGELVQVKEGENQIIKNDQKQEKEGKQIQILGDLYQLLNKKETRGCFAIAMDKDEKILVTGKYRDVMILGSITLKHNLSGHKEWVNFLCFGNKRYWFISAGIDNTIRIWQEQEQGKWECIQIIENQDSANQIIITNDDENFISCHFDHKIRIWMKNKNNQQWECYQTLNEHTEGVKFISLSQNGQYLVSSQFYDGKMILWSKATDQKWQCKQQLTDDYHRLSFISNNELIVTSQKIGRLRRYQINDKGTLQLQQTLDFDKYEEKERNYHSKKFPMIFNQQFKLAIFRHFAQTYIMKQQENGDFQIHQKIYGNHIAGYMFRDSKTLILVDLTNGTRNQFNYFEKSLPSQQIIQQNQQFQSNNQQNQFFLLNKQAVESRRSIVFDYKEQILLSAQNKNIILWDINTQGSLNQKQALEVDYEDFNFLCFGNKGYWFISAGTSIRIWQQQEQGDWKCIQIIEIQYPYQIFITNDDKQFISFNVDKIRIWMKNKKNQQWECYQTLKEHTKLVKFISLSQNGQYLVFSSRNKMILYSKGNDQKWQYKQELHDDYHRLCFISNNELIVTSREVGRLRRYFIYDNGGSSVLQTLDFDIYEEEEKKNQFPMIYKQQLKLAIFRHFAQTYIMKQQENGDFQIHQKIYGNHTAGFMQMNGQFLILCDNNEELQVWKIR